jgi:hypothetical protein
MESPAACSNRFDPSPKNDGIALFSAHYGSQTNTLRMILTTLPIACSQLAANGFANRCRTTIRLPATRPTGDSP